MDDCQRDKADLINELVQLRQENQALKGHIETIESRSNQMETVFNLAPVGLCLLDDQLRYVGLNKFFAEMNGITVAEHIGHTLRDIVPDLSEQGETAFKKVIETGEAQLNLEISRTTMAAPGVHKYWNENWLPIKDTAGKVTGILVTAEDVTERKRMEEALLEGTSKYRDLFNSIDEGFCIIEVLFDDHDYPLDYRFLEVNQTFERQTGLVDAVGRCMRDMAPNHEQHWFDIYGHIALTGEPTRFQNPAQALGRFYDVYAFRVGNPEQRRVAILFNDIHWRKLAEEALRESEAKLRIAEAVSTERQRLFNVLETLPVMVCLLTPDYHIAFANRSFREKFGEANGRHCYEYCFGNNEPCAFCESYKVLETGQPHHWEVNLDGTIIDAYDFPFTDVEGSPMILEMNVDITERRMAEEALRQSGERFTRIFMNSPAPMAIIRMRDDQCIDVNQKLLDLTGYSREEVVGSTPLQLGLGVQDSHCRESLLAELSGKGEVQSYEYKIRSKSGKNITVQSSVILTTLDNEACRIALIKDITKQKEMEAEMARLDRLNLIGEMAASIGHEIRNPMTSVRGFLQMLGGKPEYQDDSSYFELMIEELDRANSIISEYLGMAKNKNVDLRANSLDLMITTLYPILMSDANLMGINIRLDLCTPPEIHIDDREIRQLILNLARNGMEAMAGKGTLTVGTILETDDIVLYIKDEGPGIPPQILDKLGIPFVTTKNNGTGLGLPVCYSIVARHKAKIDFETGPSGTTFYVKFPLPNKGM